MHAAVVGCAQQPALGGLLQVVLYHQEACEAISDDALLELCDWCYRQLLFLNKDAAQIANKAGERIAALPFQSVGIADMLCKHGLLNLAKAIWRSQSMKSDLHVRTRGGSLSVSA